MRWDGLWRVTLVVTLLFVLALVGASSYLVRRGWPQTDGTLQAEGLHARATVIRDTWGVPHIYATNSHDLFFTQGYVHAQDRFAQMELWRRYGSGRLAELLGEPALARDRLVRTLGWTHVVAREVELLDPSTRAALQAYADGVNAYLRARGDRLGLEFSVLALRGVRHTPEPWTIENSLTWAKVMAWDLGGNLEEELIRAALVNRVGADRLAELYPAYPPDQPVIVAHPAEGTIASAGRSADDSGSSEATLHAATLQGLPWQGLDSMTGPFGRGMGLGSNNWVVSGERTETGRPLLANDPHLLAQIPSIWYQVGLHCEPCDEGGPLHVVGASFASTPGVVIGHNDRIAWGVTNVNPDVQDLYVLRVNPDNPDQYEFDGQWVDMEIRVEEIIVQGREKPVRIRVRSTEHGPILNDTVVDPEQPWTLGWQPLALRWTSLEPGTMMQAVLRLNRARNWDEFREAVRWFDGPSQNFIYADVEGNIGYQMPGRVPVRRSGDGSMPSPGWDSSYAWGGFAPFEDLPYAYNPPEGYIITANNAIVRSDQPHLITCDWGRGYRARRILELLEPREHVSIADFQALQADVYQSQATELLPFLLDLKTNDPRLRRALEVLAAWDLRADTDSSAAAILEVTRLELLWQVYADQLGEEMTGRYLRSPTLMALHALSRLLEDPHAVWFDDIYTPEAETRDDVLLSSLEAAVTYLEDEMGRDALRWQWGTLHTTTFVHSALGRSGIAPLETFFNRGPLAIPGSADSVYNTAYDPTDPYAAMLVPSYRQIVDVGGWENSLAMSMVGQSGHAMHPHYDNLLQQWRDVEYYAMLWDRAAVEAEAGATLVLTPQDAGHLRE
ncbi:MAG: penicillin acylase family protein [Anaerolineae bacterium]